MKSVLRAVALAALLFPIFALSQTAPTGSFTLATQVNSNGTLTPTLTWSTTPAATSCSASGDTAWTGSKAASGTQALAAFPASTPKIWTLLCNWPGQSQVMLTCTPPTQYTDGAPITNLAGYRFNWGVTAAALTQAAQTTTPTTCAYTVTNLAPGTWYFGVKAYTTQGAESALSNVISRNVTGPIEWSQSTGVKVPQAPTGLQ